MPSGAGNATALEQLLADCRKVHLIWPIADSNKSGVNICSREERILRYTGGTVDLDGTIDHAGSHTGHHDFGSSDQIPRGLVAFTIHLVSRLQRQEPRLGDLAKRMRDIFPYGALFGQRQRG